MLTRPLSDLSHHLTKTDFAPALPFCYSGIIGSSNNSIRVVPANRFSRRTLLVLALVCVTLLGQSLALFSQDQAHHATDHCCLLCHAGPLPFLRTTVASAVAPVFLVAWMAATPDFEPVPHVLLSASSSRGPPAA